MELKHPLEETKSWELYREKQQRQHRNLKTKSGDNGDDKVHDETHHHHHHHLHHHSHHDEDEDKDKSSKEKHDEVNDKDKSSKEKQDDTEDQQSTEDKDPIPEADPGTFHGLMIDAGSQGTRIHIYEFENRILDTPDEIRQAVNGYKLSIPTTNSRWTNRLKPGLDVCASVKGGDEELQAAITEYLAPVLDFAKMILGETSTQWHKVPIYLKATGGLRTLPTADRVRLMENVRKVFHNKTFNPFSFEDERARVISGEEEAIYGWAAVNFLKGTLIKDSEGTGTVLNPKRTVGMLEMGGASTQIGFFEKNGDIMANLFKLQIGGARHFNVYAHSFLYFGINGAWDRLNAQLVGRNHNINPCLPVSSNYTFDSWIHVDEDRHYLPRSDPRSTIYSTDLYNNISDFKECSRLTRDLLRKPANHEWVEFSHDGDCSFAGVYQPPLPTNQSGVNEFIATSNYFHVWEFLQLPERSSVRAVGKAAKRVCALTESQLQAYNAQLLSPVHEDDLMKYCFRSVFVFEILHSGYGFPLDYEIIAADVIDNQKTGWALGSILYEVNTLPWEFGGKLKIKPSPEVKVELLGMPNPHSSSHKQLGVSKASDTYMLFAVIGLLLGTVVSSVWYRRRRHQHYQEI